MRIIAATNRDLKSEVKQGRFREDLFFRLNVVALVVPPLRERKEDIPELAQGYIDYFRAKIGADVHSIHSDALGALSRYDWPGNVRELVNVVERAMLLCTGSEITDQDLPSDILVSSMGASEPLLYPWTSMLGRSFCRKTGKFANPRGEKTHLRDD